MRSNSLSSYFKGAAVSLISSILNSSVICTTNSFVFSIFIAVSLRLPLLLCAAIAIIGGLLFTTLKKLNGAPFKLPFSSSDVTNAIGLGITEPLNNL